MLCRYAEICRKIKTALPVYLFLSLSIVLHENIYKVSGGNCLYTGIKGGVGFSTKIKKLCMGVAF